MSEVSNIIKNTIERFYNKPWTHKDFLTEDDVRCRLFMDLQNALQDGHEASVNAEVRWYGGNHKLKYRSDIVIIDKNDLEIADYPFKLPSKGYAFNKYHAVIEIKLRRLKGISKNKFEKGVSHDIKKLKELKEKVSEFSRYEDKQYFALAFDKKDKKKMLYEISNSDDPAYVDWLVSENNQSHNTTEQNNH